MTRRLLLIATAVTSLLAGPSALAAGAETAVAIPDATLTPTTHNSYGDWFCVAVADKGVCQSNPFPEQNPLPPPPVARPVVPALPALI